MFSPEIALGHFRSYSHFLARGRVAWRTKIGHLGRASNWWGLVFSPSEAVRWEGGFGRAGVPRFGLGWRLGGTVWDCPPQYKRTRVWFRSCRSSLGSFVGCRALG